MKAIASAVPISLTPCVPYAWQIKGEAIEIPTARSKNINVAGFFSKKNQLIHYYSETSINSEKLMEIFNNYALKTTKKQSLSWIMPLFTKVKCL